MELKCKLGSSAAVSKFCEWVQVGIDGYMAHRKYQVKPHSSSWFSATCPAAIARRNQLFCLHQQNKSFESKVKFRHANNFLKEFLKLPNLYMLTKQKKGLSHPRNFAVGTFGELLIVFSTYKSAILSLFIKLQELPSASDKAKSFAKILAKNSNLILMIDVSLYLFSFLELIRNCIIFL